MPFILDEARHIKTSFGEHISRGELMMKRLTLDFKICMLKCN